VSSYFCGVAGAAMMFLWYGGGEAADAFNINQSFNILFMVIIGGLGSLIGCFFGAALLHIVPIILKFGLPALGVPLSGATAEHLVHILIGALIIFFLIVEPHGLARLWQITKQKLRVWPFPY
jgi:branched-chain amino acid transport system permease protein